MPDSSIWLETIKDFSRRCPLVFYGEIPGHLPSGKNQYIIGRGGGGKGTLRKHPDLLAYEQIAFYHLRRLMGSNGLKGPILGTEDGERVHLALACQVWFQSYRRDVDTILLCDILQKAGVVENDRMIRMKLINGVDVDPERPRVEFGLYRVPE